MTPQPERQQNVWVWRASGWLLLFAYVSMTRIWGGFDISFHAPFTRLEQGETNLWLSSVFLATPAALLLGVGYQQQLGVWFERLRTRIAASSRAERVGVVGALTVLAAVLANLGNRWILSGYPVTDDEWAVRFGGAILAAGHVSVKPPFDFSAVPQLFLYVTATSLTSIDWLGAQLAWAAAELAGLGHEFFAPFAALPVAALTYVVGKREGRAWGLGAAVLFIASPMAFALSMTTHAHLLSRAFVALSLALFVWANKRQTNLSWAAVGLSVGTGLITRPFEMAALMLPLCVDQLIRLIRTPARKNWLSLGVVAIAAAIPLILFFVHAHAVTGTFWPPRFGPGAQSARTMELSYVSRFGGNIAFNFLRLGVWFAGPLGFCFAAFGLHSRLNRLLGLGVLTSLFIGLFHDNYGVGVVGPMHHSECVVPLTVLALSGLARLTRALRGLELTSRFSWLPTSALVTWMVVGLFSFSLFQAAALRHQSDIQRVIYDGIEAAIPPEQRPAVVFAPPFGQVWMQSYELREQGSWVFEWRRPQPSFDDPVMILLEGAAEPSVRAAFPQRHFFRLRAFDELPFVKLEPIH